MGNYYHWCRKDYERALKELAIAEKGRPNDSLIQRDIGDVRQFQGRFEAAADRFKKAFELSPRDANIPWELFVALRYSRNYAEADHYLEIGINLSPDRKFYYEYRAKNYLSWKGDIKKAREVLEEIPGEDEDVRSRLQIVWWYERNYDAILELVLSGSRPLGSGEALDAASIYDLKGDSQLAYAYYDSARVILERELDEHPESANIHSHLGVAYAGLGRMEDAIREGRRGVELLPVSTNPIYGPFQVSTLAEIFTLVGEYDAALDQVEYLLSIPCMLSVHDFRLAPWWDPLRSHPRFQSLMEKYAIE
jgi:tetratricopeptide (TPR) repeat protein